MERIDLMCPENDLNIIVGCFDIFLINYFKFFFLKFEFK